MAEELFPVRIPPGVVKLGTDYAGKGRWVESALVRWADGGVMQAVGGWSVLPNARAVDIDGPVRGLLAYRRHNGQARVLIGTPSRLYDYWGGTLVDVTPAGFSAGPVQASGDYFDPTEAATWQMDMWGEDPVVCMQADGGLYRFDSSIGGTVFDITDAPAGNVGVVVTPERFLVALGPDGDRRAVSWPDQESLTDWTASTTNQAGTYWLPTDGQIMAGRKGRQETLIWTDLDLWSMRYVGGELVYSFTQVGSNCGALSRRAMVVHDGRAFWMGRRGFFVYDGYVKPIDCPVGDYVWGRLNRDQASQVHSQLLSDYHEVWWHYPTGGSDCDEAVVWNFQTNTWRIEPLRRTAGIDRGVLQYPLAGGPDGAVYEHETGSTYQDQDGTSYTPYAESSPIEIGDGSRVMHLDKWVPDGKSLGGARVKVFSAPFPTGPETDEGYFTLANPTDMRITARQIRVRVEQVAAGWRWGVPRLSARPGGYR